jgi:hypothetical protein
MPAAPAASVAGVFSAVMPPRARTGMGAAARQAARRRVRPVAVDLFCWGADLGIWAGGVGLVETNFSKTGPKRMRLGRA